ncbi:nitroreductase family protein [Deinococcus planocerae]|uniref:nitroreductase family protein n=1 Tax=Deinococcus planocerae TaxID=1737569 RepID=UPI000C7F14A0|nr:nitroreductase family protein [Deinococcus planocerae]
MTVAPPHDPPTRHQTAEQVRAFFDAHRTVRHYKPVAMPPDHLGAILHAAQRAPTDATAQLYSFIRLKDAGVRERVAALTTNAHIAQASESFVVCLDVRRTRRVLEAAGHVPGEWPAIAVHFGIGDAALAGQNMLLAAEMLGYQGCWIGGVMNNLEALIEELRLPEGVLPYAALTIGVSDEPTPYRPRLPRELVVHEDAYRDADEGELRGATEVMNPIAARQGQPGDWARLLRAYFGQGGSMEERELGLVAALGRQGLRAGDRQRREEE